MDTLSARWTIPSEIYEMQLGQRKDIVEKEVTVDETIFHIPYLREMNQYVLWKCLWPDCNNCCLNVKKLPLVREDIDNIKNELGYQSRIEFIKNETLISTIQQVRNSGRLITTSTMITLRQDDRSDKYLGCGGPCRFVTDVGCRLHPNKPSVCSIYPFSPSIELSKNGRVVTHAKFQFTGECPGFYLDKSVDTMMPILKEYSKKLYDYCMAFRRTLRENYGSSSQLAFNPDQ